jgi:hypothetical protein
MQNRVTYAASGVATVGASIALLCAVTMTNSAVLATSAGAAVGVDPIVLSVAERVSAVPTIASAPTVQKPAEPQSPTKTAEVVPADETAVVVPAQEPASVSTRPAASHEVARPTKTAPKVSGEPALIEPGSQTHQMISQTGEKKPKRDKDRSGDLAPHVNIRPDQSASADRRDAERSQKTDRDAHQTRSHDSPDRRDR